MKRTTNTVLLLSVALISTTLFAQPITILGPVTVTGSDSGMAGSASIHGQPADPYTVGVRGTSQSMGVHGNTASGIGVMGSATDGIGGAFTAYGNGIALSARLSDWYGVGEGAVALSVDGPVEIKRNKRSRLRVYNPTTGALIGEFEFEVVLDP